jgi:hypothetical protein
VVFPPMSLAAEKVPRFQVRFAVRLGPEATLEGLEARLGID